MHYHSLIVKFTGLANHEGPHPCLPCGFCPCKTGKYSGNYLNDRYSGFPAYN